MQEDLARHLRALQETNEKALEESARAIERVRRENRQKEA